MALTVEAETATLTGADPATRANAWLPNGRRGKLKALVAVARSILVIVWHLLAAPTARFRDLGSDFYAVRVNQDRKGSQPGPSA